MQFHYYIFFMCHTPFYWPRMIDMVVDGKGMGWMAWSSKAWAIEEIERWFMGLWFGQVFHPPHHGRRLPFFTIPRINNIIYNNNSKLRLACDVMYVSVQYVVQCGKCNTIKLGWNWKCLRPLSCPDAASFQVSQHGPIMRVKGQSHLQWWFISHSGISLLLFY